MKLSTKEIIVCGLFASIAAVLSQVSIPIPFTNVPLTMQIFAIMLTGMILGPKLGFISQIIYVSLGIIGMPVYAQMSGGIGIVLGHTGGFILSFPIVALIVGYFTRKYNNSVGIYSGMMIGLICSYVIGTIQFCIITKMSFASGLMACVIPFIPLDIVKIILVYIVGKSINARIKLGVNI